MLNTKALVVTSISKPNVVLKSLSEGCRKHQLEFIVIGDVSSPSDFHLEGCRFYSLAGQKRLDFKFARLCPERHYARKNIGYLVAMSDGADLIIDTDDDNRPYDAFWDAPRRSVTAPVVEKKDWVNIYRYFSRARVWPRGFPLNKINDMVPDLESLAVRKMDCPVQQGLADDDPDVDAIYRLVFPHGVKFDNTGNIILGPGAWCPFNSQNTAWWKDAFPLLYLPSYCSFRMTDIWRSFVAQRIAWENGWHILFHGATVYQERNEHNLMKDFQDEIPGYLNNEAVCDALMNLKLAPGRAAINENMKICYEVFIQKGLVDKKEFTLLDAWFADMALAKS